MQARRLLAYRCAKSWFLHGSCSALGGELKLMKGKVENTLTDRNNIPDKIALLRLDTDWYPNVKRA